MLANQHVKTEVSEVPSDTKKHLLLITRVTHFWQSELSIKMIPTRAMIILAKVT